MSNMMERELDWDATIANDSPDYITLPAGDYDFEVVDFERGRHGGSANLPSCNKAVVYIKISTAQGVSTIRHQLFLHSKTEGLLCEFFRGIGQRKKGESFTMNWNAVPGARGRCKVGIRTYDGKEYNEIKKFYDSTQAQGQVGGQAPKGYEPGRF